MARSKAEPKPPRKRALPAAMGTCTSCQTKQAAGEDVNPRKMVKDVEVETAGGGTYSTKLCASCTKALPKRK